MNLAPSHGRANVCFFGLFMGFRRRFELRFPTPDKFVVHCNKFLILHTLHWLDFTFSDLH